MKQALLLSAQFIFSTPTDQKAKAKLPAVTICNSLRSSHQALATMATIATACSPFF